MSIEPTCCNASSKSPAQRRHERVRNSIIAAAEKMFAREGELAVSMRRLAEETDYSPAALYKYFGSKAEVFNAVRESFFERLLARMDQATLSGGGNPEQICRATARAYIATALENPGTYLMAYSSWSDYMPLNDDSFGNRAAAKLESMISAGVASGAFRQQDVSLAGKSIWAAVHGLTSLLIQIQDLGQGVDGSESYSIEEMTEFHINFLIGGLQSQA